MTHTKTVQRLVFGVAIFMLFITVMPAFAAPLFQADYDVAVLPADLGRLSWGAVIAGAIIALMIQLGLNLLGIGVGATTITADPHDPTDEATSMGSAARMTVIWMAISTLIALFFGGWLAARFAGLPNGLDGMLHGLMVWGIVMIITLFLITTTVGRLFSSLSNMIGQAMTLMTRVTGAAAQAASSVAGAAANVAGSAAQGVGKAMNAAGSTVTHAAQPVVEDVREQVEHRVQEELKKHPELNQALSNQTVARQKIEEEARKLLSEAGIEPERIESEMQVAAEQVKQATQVALDEVAKDPRQAVTIMMDTLGRILEHGADVVNEVDRQSILDVLKTRTGQTEQQARETLTQWENRFQQARSETERIRGQAESQIHQLRDQAEAKMQQVRTQIEEKVADVRHDIDIKAREVAASTTKAISRLALAAFGAILIGAIAAGLGGAMGAPQELPVAAVDFDNTSRSTGDSDAMTTPMLLVIEPTITPVP